MPETIVFQALFSQRKVSTEIIGTLYKRIVYSPSKGNSNASSFLHVKEMLKIDGISPCNELIFEERRSKIVLI